MLMGEKPHRPQSLANGFSRSGRDDELHYILIGAVSQVEVPSLLQFKFANKQYNT
jgi:hypothetical protein